LFLLVSRSKCRELLRHLICGRLRTTPQEMIPPNAVTLGGALCAGG
jgi:hypothetical protein